MKFRPLSSIDHLPAILVGLALVLATATGEAAEVKPPQRIADQGKIIYCTDLTFPPWDMVNSETLQPDGFDIDIAAAVSKAMGVSAEHKNIAFDGLIPALQASQCDAIISGLYDKPARREVVDFVNYAFAGNALIVKADSELFVNALVELSGKKIAVQSGTVLEEEVVKANDELKVQSKPVIDIVSVPAGTDAYQQLLSGLVDVYYGTSDQAGYFNKQNPGQVKMGSPQLSALYTGIATRKDDQELHQAIDQAFAAIQASGEYAKILEKWGFQPLTVAK